MPRRKRSRSKSCTTHQATSSSDQYVSTAAQQSNTQHVRGCRGRSKGSLECDAQTFADLRERWAPLSPEVYHSRFNLQSASPKSQGDVNTFQYDLSGFGESRAQRWHYWHALADIGVLTRQLFKGSEFEDAALRLDPDSTAGPGSKGQFVVYTTEGTIIYLERTGRLYSPNATADLLRRLRIRFAPWQPQEATDQLLTTVEPLPDTPQELRRRES